MAKRITFGLSVKEINDAIKEIYKYKDEINNKCHLLTKRLAEEGVRISKLKIANSEAVFTGELLNSMNSESIKSTKSGSTWVVYTDCQWAPYVEFGTGIVGSQSPHPDTSLVNWKYDINDHGEKGWFYQRDGEWHWTKGMPSRPFMYETGKELREIVTRITKEVLPKLIDKANQIFTNVKTAVGTLIKGSSQTFENAPSSFPYLYFNQMDNRMVANDFDNNENAVEVTIEITVYTISTSKLTEGKKIINIADAEMCRMGFRRLSGPLQLANINDSNTCRILARYTRIIGNADTL